MISIAVAYKEISRTGSNDSFFGRNGHSWCLEYNRNIVSIWHNNEQTHLSASCSYKIGVYVDYRRGILCFYSVSDTAMCLLHKVQTTFTGPLYPGFRMFSNNTSAEIL